MAARYILLLPCFAAQVLTAVLTVGPRWDERDGRHTFLLRDATIEDNIELFYYSVNESPVDGTTWTTWAPWTLMTASSILTTKVNDNLAVCSNSYEYITITDRLTTSTSVSWYTDISDFSSNECLVWTACNGGSISGIYLNSSTTQTFCDYQGSGCHTINLRKQFGDTIGGLTFLNCIATTSGQDTKTIMYQIKPASTGLTTTSSSTATPGSSPSGTPSPTSSASPVPSESPTPHGNNYTGAIAGSVVGGVAILAIAGVAILWILKRNKQHDGALHTALHTPTPYQADFESTRHVGSNNGHGEQRVSEVPWDTPQFSPAGFGNDRHSQTSVQFSPSDLPILRQ